ncbi:HTH domain-containing protein [Bifidobacterium aerophilum]|uniref:Uncharacterized protein n=1 Tax=Bifidobacterium aerophilum TaxID=1798155 RepID=A0A6N9Z8B8_9BIFI|nr:HTH domain-containing protein [Bifidobacterium aerophilum]NEG90630.1 hypothetical protein [Bifidobacterium aerophilum]
MGNSAFTQEEIAYLYSLPAVSRVTNGRITYSESFKKECTRQYLAGKSPARLFREAGLDPSLIGYKRVERCVARWKVRYGAQVKAEAEAGASGSDSGSAQSGGPLAGGAAAAVSAMQRFMRYGQTGELPFAPDSAEGRAMTDMLFRQQIRHIDELEKQLDDMRRRVARLTGLLERHSAAAPQDIADIIASGKTHGIAVGGGYTDSALYEVYVVRRDENGNIAEVREFVEDAADLADAVKPAKSAK